MEICVNDYIRTKDGFIRKVGEIDRCQECNEKIYISVDIIDGLHFERSWHLKEIVSHSKNIIDLIEVGDYVNGKKVLRINDYEDFKRADFNLDYDDGDAVYNEDIKTILTKEQYEQNSYKIGE